MIDVDDSSDSQFPRAAMGSGGKGIVAWYRGDLSVSGLHSAWFSSVDHGNWSPTVSFSDLSQLIDLQAGGNKFAAITQANNGILSVWQYDPSAGWTAGPPLSDVVTSDVNNLQARVSINAANEMLVTWNHISRLNISTVYYSVQVARFSLGAWSPVVTFSFKNSDSPQPVIGQDGSQWIIWTELGTANSDRYTTVVSKYTGRVWSTPQAIDMPSGNAFRPSMVALPGGELAVVWEQYDGARYRIYANRYKPDSGWAGALPIDNGSSDSVQASIAADANGNLIVSWRQTDATNVYSLWATRFIDGVWQSPVMIIGSKLLLCSSPVGVGGDGLPLILWSEMNGAGAGIWSKQYTSNNGWQGGNSVKLSASTYCPMLSMNAAGDALATWVDRSTNKFRVWSAVFK